MDEKNLVLVAYIRNNSCMGHVTFFASFGHKKQPVTRSYFFNTSNFCPEFRLLPGYSGHFYSNFRINGTDKSRAVYSIFIITTRSVRSPGIGSGDFNDLWNFFGIISGWTGVGWFGRCSSCCRGGAPACGCCRSSIGSCWWFPLLSCWGRTFS